MQAPSPNRQHDDWSRPSTPRPSPKRARRFFLEEAEVSGSASEDEDLDDFDERSQASWLSAASGSLAGPMAPLLGSSAPQTPAESLTPNSPVGTSASGASSPSLQCGPTTSELRLRSRRWSFTAFGFADLGDDPTDPPPPEWLDNMSYLITGREVCPETGKVHWQSYVEFKVRITLSSIKTLSAWYNKYHFEISEGSAKQNITYCLKECGDIYLEYGEPMAQGKRSDLVELTRQMYSGNLTLRDLREDSPAAHAQYFRHFEKVWDDVLCEKEKEIKPIKVNWFYGVTGSGKSHRAHKEAGRDAYKWVAWDTKWWDNYEGQKKVLFDEFRGPSDIAYHRLLVLLDQYPVSINRRNRNPVPWMAEEVWITSDRHPAELYEKEIHGDPGQLLRRITNLVHFPFAFGVPPPPVSE